MAVDYLRYYWLELYIFEDVHRRFHAERSIGAFDFFSIISWKANRAKPAVATSLLRAGRPEERTLEARTRALTSSLYNAAGPRERMRILLQEWRFGLTMASAVLSVLWPDDFTVYDYRVRELLGYIRPISESRNFDKTWDEYSEFVERLRSLEMPPGVVSLRDRDRYLWSTSVAQQLEEDIKRWESSSP